MDHYYEMKNMLPQSHGGYQPVETGHNADDRELKQVLEQTDTPEKLSKIDGISQDFFSNDNLRFSFCSMIATHQSLPDQKS